MVTHRLRFFNANALLLIGYLLVAVLVFSAAGLLFTYAILRLQHVLPLCLVFAVFLVSQGTIENFRAYDTATLVEPMGEVTTQTIVQGPLASQSAIKMLGTNGGGYPIQTPPNR